MSAAIIVFNDDHSLKQVIGPFDDGQAAADHSATLEWSSVRMIVQMTSPTPIEPCPYTMSHTRAFCGHPDCREQ